MKRLVTSLLLLLGVLAALDQVSSEQSGGHHKGHNRHAHRRQHALDAHGRHRNQDIPPTLQEQLLRFSQSPAAPSPPQSTSLSLSETYPASYDPSQAAGGGGGSGGKCVSCVDRELFKNFTREEIREKILRKLGMVSAPNVTAEGIPEHLIKQLVKRYRHEFEIQNDEAAAGGVVGGGNGGVDEDDDYHFQTKQINILSKTREFCLPFRF